jgi:putative ATPase
MANSDLFQTDQLASEPLASRMRPRSLQEYVGQDHILGPGKLLRRAIEADQLGSLIFSGPPGTGKTTLAKVIANSTKGYFTGLNAVLSGVKEVRDAIAEAQERKDLYGRKTILFVDEVHRWNKSQQDALLPWVENGTITLIGATTENPFFEVNKALVSRSRIFQLLPLKPEHLKLVALQALEDSSRGLANYYPQISPEALDHLIHICAGDARTLLNALELAVLTTPPDPVTGIVSIGLEEAEQSIQEKAVLYDKDGDYHFDTISAFIKSIRGSDPDAALFWMARMILAGESPRYIFRRMLISASEDIGLADPAALGIVESAASAFDRVGLPEGQFFLSQAALYLAMAPKSNSAMAYFDALNQNTRMSPEVPNHLRDPARDKHSFGHGEGYLYPHAYKDHWVSQQYLPRDLQGQMFYTPGDLGWEGERKQLLQAHREVSMASVSQLTPSSDQNNLSYRDDPPGLTRWIERTSQLHSNHLLNLRKELLDLGQVLRTDRVFILGQSSLFLLWEILRSCPEGYTGFMTNSAVPNKMIEELTQFFDIQERPHISSSVEQLCSQLPPGFRFEKIIGKGLLETNDFDLSLIIEQIRSFVTRETILVTADLLYGSTQPLSKVFTNIGLSTEGIRLIEKAENYQPIPSNRTINELTKGESRIVTIPMEFVIQQNHLRRWFPSLYNPPEKSAQGNSNKQSDSNSIFSQGIALALTTEEQVCLHNLLKSHVNGKAVSWEITYEVSRYGLTESFFSG